MAIDIVDLTIVSMVIFDSYVNVYQRVNVRIVHITQLFQRSKTVQFAMVKLLTVETSGFTFSWCFGTSSYGKQACLMLGMEFLSKCILWNLAKNPHECWWPSRNIRYFSLVLVCWRQLVRCLPFIFPIPRPDPISGCVEGIIAPSRLTKDRRSSLPTTK